jgi:hypothetical protein
MASTALPDRPAAQPADRPPLLEVGGFAVRSAALSNFEGVLDGGSGSGSAVISYIASMAGIGKTAPAVARVYGVACRFPDKHLRLVLDWKDDGLVRIEIFGASQRITSYSPDQAEDITNE